MGTVSVDMPIDYSVTNLDVPKAVQELVNMGQEWFGIVKSCTKVA